MLRIEGGPRAERRPLYREVSCAERIKEALYREEAVVPRGGLLCREESLCAERGLSQRASLCREKVLGAKRRPTVPRGGPWAEWRSYVPSGSPWAEWRPSVPEGGLCGRKTLPLKSPGYNVDHCMFIVHFQYNRWSGRYTQET